MVQFPQIIKYVRNVLCVLLLYIMLWQQWTTFSKYEKKFLSPIEFTKQNYGNDFISQYGKRFEEIKKMFKTPTHLCYLGEANESFAIWSANYSLTQYYLSPNVLIKDNISCDTVLYNLYNSFHINPESNFHLKNGWHIVKDFNNGLIVLAK